MTESFLRNNVCSDILQLQSAKCIAKIFIKLLLCIAGYYVEVENQIINFLGKFTVI